VLHAGIDDDRRHVINAGGSVNDDRPFVDSRWRVGQLFIGLLAFILDGLGPAEIFGIGVSLNQGVRHTQVINHGDGAEIFVLQEQMQDIRAKHGADHRRQLLMQLPDGRRILYVPDV
jgi:hypothetical protein